MQRNRIMRAAGLMLILSGLPGSVAAQTTAPTATPTTTGTGSLEQRLDIHRISDHVLRGGMPEADDFKRLAADGVARVICLIDPAQVPAGHRELAVKAGLTFEHTPIVIDRSVPPDQIRIDRKVVRKMVERLGAEPNVKTYVYDKTGQGDTAYVNFVYRTVVDRWCFAEALEETIDRGFSGRMLQGVLDDMRLTASGMDERPFVQRIRISRAELFGRGEMVRVGTVSLHVKRFGQGKPVFVLHGGPGENHLAFRPYVDALADGSSVVYYDHRGCGLSGKPQLVEAYKLEQLVQELDGLREALGYEKISLLGHSSGGILAVSYALAHRERVDKLVIVSSWASGEEFRRFSPNVIRGMLTADDDKTFTEVIEEAQSQRRGLNDLELAQIVRVTYPYSFFGKFSPAFASDWNMRSGVSSFVNSAMAPEVIRALDLRDRLPELSGLPTLVIVGAMDVFTPVPVMRTFADRIGGARLEVFEHSGHYPFVEENERFIKTVSAFLENGG